MFMTKSPLTPYSLLKDSLYLSVSYDVLHANELYIKGVPNAYDLKELASLWHSDQHSF